MYFDHDSKIPIRLWKSLVRDTPTGESSTGMAGYREVNHHPNVTMVVITMQHTTEKVQRYYRTLLKVKVPNGGFYRIILGFQKDSS